MSDNICPHCQRHFTRKDNMLRHINEKRCKMLSSPHPLQPKKKMTQIEKKFQELKNELTEQKNREIAEIKEEFKEEIKRSGSTQVNQVLQVICVTNNDNYLDMLTERLGNLGDAIEYIKDCALSDVSGDCKLIEKIYLVENHKDTDLNEIHYADNGKTKISFYNEKHEKVVESKLSMSKKFANNLQNSYLKGINYIINRNLDEHSSPNKLLEEYDLMLWNTHIYNLSDMCYQRKMINQLSIPVLQEYEKK